MTTDAQTTTTNQNTETTLPPFSLDVLPEQFRTNPIFKDFKSWEGLLTSHEGAVKKIGVPADQLLRVNPDGSMPPETRAKLGIPDKYEFPLDIQNAPAFSDARKQELTDYATKNNLSKTQFDQLVRTEDAYSQKTTAAQAELAKNQRIAAEAALKTALGDAYDQNINLAKDALDTFKKKGLWDVLDKANLTTDPEVINFLAEIGKIGSEEAPIEGQRAGGGFKLTPNQAQAEINAKRADPVFNKAYRDAAAPNHAEAVAEMTRLYGIAFSG